MGKVKNWILLVSFFLVFSIPTKAESNEFDGEYRKIVLNEFPGYRAIDFLEVAPNVYFVCIAAHQGDSIPRGKLIKLSIGHSDYHIEILHTEKKRLIHLLNKLEDRICVVVRAHAPGISGIDEFSLLCYDLKTGEEAKKFSPPFQFVKSAPLGSTVRVEDELFLFFNINPNHRLVFTVWDVKNGEFLRWGTISGVSPTSLSGVTYCEFKDVFLVYVIHGILEVSRDMVAINYLSREEIGHNYTGMAVCLPDGNILVGGSESGHDWHIEGRPIVQMAKVSLFDSDWNLISRDSFIEYQGYVNGFTSPPKVDFERKAIYANPGFEYDSRMMRCDSDFRSLVIRYDFDLNVVWSIFFDPSTYLQAFNVVPISVGCAVTGAKLDCEDGEPTFYPFVKLFDETTVHAPGEEAEVNALNILGNPGREALTLSLESPTEEELRVEVFNTAGRLMGVYHISTGVNTIDASQWPSGVYIVRAISAGSGGVWSKKWVKK